MNHQPQNLHQFLDQSFARFREAPAEQVASSCERVLDRLRQGTERSGSAVLNDGAHDYGYPTRRRRFAIALAAATTIVIVALAIQRFSSRAEVHASVEVVDGSLYRTSPAVESRINAGETIRAGESVRSAKGGGAVLALVDGSRIEMRPESKLSLESASDGARIRLNAGSVIVSAAKQGAGHLYVQTKDVSVSVVGTVFLVNAEQAGSRVVVIQGEVQVRQGAASRKLAPGEQVASNPLMESHPLVEEIAWSREAEEHLALLQRSTANAAPERLQFEAATIKPDPERNPFAGFSCKGVDGVLPEGAALRNPPEYPVAPPAPLGRCVGSASLTLLSLAYGVRGDHIVVDIDSASFYRIEAKAEDPSTTTKEQLLEMLRNFVIDRFKLKVHRKTEEGEGYILQVATSGGI